MAKKNAYQQANEDIAAIIAEAKSRKGWTDKDIGKLIGSKGIKAESVKNNRSRGVFPNMRFCDVSVLAEAAGYDVVFRKKEVYR